MSGERVGIMALKVQRTRRLFFSDVLAAVLVLVSWSLSNNDGDGYENVTYKVKLRCLKLDRAKFFSFSSSNVGKFFGVEF